MFALLACALLGGPLNLNQLPAISPADLREDFGDFRYSLEQAHAGIYRFTTKAQMDAKFEGAKAKLSRPMTVLEFYRLLAPIETSIHCGHSGALLPADLGKQFNSDIPEFPARIEILDGKLFILHDYSGNSLDGAEVEFINGRGTAEVLRRLSPFVPRDGTVKSSTPWRLEHNWGFNGLLVSALNMQSRYECVVKAPDGRGRTLTLAGVTQARLQDQEAPRLKAEAGSISFLQD